MGKLIPYAKSPSVSFGTLQNCSEPCNGIYYMDHQQTILKVTIIAINSISTISAFLSLLVFAINFRKIRHPEASMYYMALSSIGTSFTYVISQAIDKNNFRCSSLYKNSLNDSILIHDGLQNPFCATLFAILYYFTLAGWIWWTVMTIEWVICSIKRTLFKWKWAILLHIISWSAPLPFVIISLSLHAVSSSPVINTCWVSNQNNGYYQLSLVVIPSIGFVLLNSLLLIVGFLIGFRKKYRATANLNTSLQSNAATADRHFTPPHLLRTTSYSVLALLINAITMCCYLYEYMYQNAQEIKYLHAQVHLSTPACFPGSSDGYIDVLVVTLVRIVSSQLMTVLLLFWLPRKELLCDCKCHKEHDLNATITSSAIHSRSISTVS